MNRQLISKKMSLVLRSVAILMVVLSHYFEAGAYAVSNPKVAEFIMKWGDPGCGIFFFLSGYALYLKYKDKNTDKEYLIKRFWNAYIPYILIAGFISIYAKELHAPIDYIRLLTGYNYWFMLEIFILYLVFYLVGKLPAYRIGIMNAFILVMSFWLYFHGYAEFWYTATWCFGVGMIFALINKHDSKAGTEKVSTENTGAEKANVKNAGVTHNDIKTGIKTNVAKEKSVLISGIKKYNPINVIGNVVAYLGSISLYIYMLHMFIYYRVVNNEVCMKLNWYVQVLISFLITVVIAGIMNAAIGWVMKKCMNQGDIKKNVRNSLHNNV